MNYISTFYFFQSLTGPLNSPPAIQEELEEQGRQLGMKGLFILGSEGLNTTCSFPSPDARVQFQKWILGRFQLSELLFKDSQSEVPPFPKLKIKLRQEIVTLGTPELVPTEKTHRHLSPKEWEKALAEEGVAVIDTRNDYEYRIGTFRGAVNPNIEQFTEFPEFFDKQGYQKDQKILIFCTGGIRCEKGILELERQGYSNVYQLEGGILRYLEHSPRKSFEGECYVFDQRVAVDQELRPSATYKICPHCGDPADHEVQCIRCDFHFKVCPDCARDAERGSLCSKNCLHHHRLNPSRKGRHQDRSSGGVGVVSQTPKSTGSSTFPLETLHNPVSS